MKKSTFLFSIMIYAGLLTAQPEPGDIFAEFTYIPDSLWANSVFGKPKLAPVVFYEFDPSSKRREQAWGEKPLRVPRQLNVDLKHAIRAELSMEYWGGHTGTTQNFSVNGNDWVPIPQPVGTPGEPNCYHRSIFGNASVDIPLEQLFDGVNQIRFSAGPQICHSFDWGMFWIYSFTVRVYYSDHKAHVKGVISSPAASSAIGSDAIISVELDNEAGMRAKQVDVIGNYEDFNWSGDGKWKEWHYQTRYGQIRHHIGSDISKPYEIKWENHLIANQEDPIMIMAKITATNGVSYLTPAIENIQLKRDGYSVKMFKAYDLPERFSSRTGRSDSCKVDINDNLENLDRAVMTVSTWSGATSDGTIHEIRINGNKISDNFGEWHDYDIDRLNVPLEFLKQGENTISVYSEYSGHALEINWPGPALFLIRKEQ